MRINGTKFKYFKIQDEQLVYRLGLYTLNTKIINQFVLFSVIKKKIFFKIFIDIYCTVFERFTNMYRMYVFQKHHLEKYC